MACGTAPLPGRGELPGNKAGLVRGVGHFVTNGRTGERLLYEQEGGGEAGAEMVRLIAPVLALDERAIAKRSIFPCS